MDFLDRSVTVNGLNLHWVEWGAPEARPVVLLHGITGHARVWDHLAERLARDFRVLALDQRGYGDSEEPAEPDYRLATMADDLASFADALGLTTFALVGHSMGGRIAIAYAGAHPDRVERLLIVDIGPDISRAGIARVRRRLAEAPERVESEEWAVEYAGRDNPLCDPARLRHRIRHGLKRAPDGGLTWKYPKAQRDGMREGRRDPVNLWEPLARIPCPTLVVRGAETDILSPDTARRMLEVLPRGRLVEVPRAGHSVFEDQPEEFARVARAFLDA